MRACVRAYVLRVKGDLGVKVGDTALSVYEKRRGSVGVVPKMYKSGDDKQPFGLVLWAVGNREWRAGRLAKPNGDNG